MTDKSPPNHSFQIEPWQRLSFDAITSGNGGFGLIACRINGEASACIFMGRPAKGGMEVTPLFVAITPGLDVAFPDRAEGHGEEGSGPARPGAIARAFAANKAVVTAARG